MKKIFFTGFAIITILVFGDLSSKNNNVIRVENKDTNLPGWQWTSGEVEIHKTAAKQPFTIQFNPKIYRWGDSIKIIFTMYKVAVSHLSKKTFGQWKAKVGLDYYINANWIPLVADTNDRINRPFSGKNNITEDSITNDSVFFTVPLNRTLTISTSAISFEMDNVSSSPLLSLGKMGGATITTSITGIEIKKLH